MARTEAPRLIGVAEMARRTGLSKRTVYRLIERGDVPCYRAGRRIVLDPAEVLKALRAKPDG